jgi:hypothetical protein
MSEKVFFFSLSLDPDSISGSTTLIQGIPVFLIPVTGTCGFINLVSDQVLSTVILGPYKPLNYKI